MIQWYEGIITAYNTPGLEANPVSRATVQELTQGVLVTNVQMPVSSNKETLPPIGSKVAFYRDSAATAKFGFLLSDPLPIFSPISIETASLSLTQPTPVFQNGEITLSALGTNTSTSITPGGRLWLRNQGDAILYSGSQSQRIEASDATDSIDIEGTNVDIYTHGNAVEQHYIHIDDTLGVTSISLGQRNPTTGIPITRLECAFDGSFTLGAADPLLGILLSGISYNLVAAVPSPLIVPQIQLTALIDVSTLTINPLSTSINSPIINLFGPAAAGISAPADSVVINSATTEILGSVSIVGQTGIVGLTSIKGATSIVGNTSIIGILSINELPGLTTSVTVSGVTLSFVSGILVAVS